MDPAGAAAQSEEFKGAPSVRAAATVLAVMGCGAAVLALFAMTLEPADFHGALGSSCSSLTDAEAAGLRAEAALLLLSAAAQALAAVWARCVPSRVLALLASGLAAVTVYRVAFVVAAVVDAAAGRYTCHGRGFHVALDIHYLLLLVLLCVQILGAVVAAFIGDY